MCARVCTCAHVRVVRVHLRVRVCARCARMCMAGLRRPAAGLWPASGRPQAPEAGLRPASGWPPDLNYKGGLFPHLGKVRFLARN